MSVGMVKYAVDSCLFVRVVCRHAGVCCHAKLCLRRFPFSHLYMLHRVTRRWSESSPTYCIAWQWVMLLKPSKILVLGIWGDGELEDGKIRDIDL